MSEVPTFKIDLPKHIAESLRPGAPQKGRLLVAKAVLPMPPKVLCTALTFLLSDQDSEVSGAARKSLLEMPPSLVKNLVQEPLHGKSLDFFASEFRDREEIIERILLNPYTFDETFESLSLTVSENLTNIIVNNQVRLLRRPSIAEALRKNPNSLKSTMDTMVSFLKMNGVLLEGESPELTKEEIAAILKEEEPTGASEVKTLPSEVVEEDEEEEEASEERKKTIYQLVQTLGIADKVKLALRGNKEARSLLIKEANKIVATAVIKNPRITDAEVLSISTSRTAQDEVIRLIAMNPEWTKNYNLQVNLANNPKTPFPIALRYTRQLRVNDLKKLAGNKNVPQQISKIAKELYEQKRK